MESTRQRRFRDSGLLALAAALVAVTLAACGSDSTPSESGTSAKFDSDKANSVLKDATATRSWTGPDSSFAPEPGKKIFVLIGYGASDANKIAQANFKAALDKVGWDATYFDGQGSVTKYATGLGQALNGRYDGVLLYGINATLVKGPIAKLRAADIPVLAVASNIAPPSDTSVNYNIGYNEKTESLYVAAAVAVDSKGTANVGIIDDPECGVCVLWRKAFKSSLKDMAPSAKTDKTIEIQSTELYSQGLVSKIKAFLQANPDVDYIWAAYDDISISVMEALKQLGSSRDVKIVSYGGYPQLLAAMRSGDSPMLASLGTAPGWHAFEGVDTMIRIFADKTDTITPTVLNGEPAKLFTADNLPETDVAWTGDADYQSEYFKLWGVG